MNLLPIRILRLDTELPPAALVDALRGVVGDGPAAPFAGAVAADGFFITRVNDFRSTVMPLLRGRLIAQPGGGTAVLLRLRPHGTVIAFMGIWLAFLAAVAAIIVAAHARDTSRSLLLLFAPVGLGAFTWYLMSAVFSADARWALERLGELVPALGQDGSK
jgi:hypothetical protein